MKKILMMMALLAFIFIGTKAGAEQDNGNAEAKNVKVHKKQVLTNEERKVLDEKAKGKPAVSEEKGDFILPATGELGAALPFGGKKYAILVGLANYSGTINDLCVTGAKTTKQYPENSTNITRFCQDYDSVHMKEALIKQYGYDSSNITLLHDGYATRADIMAALAEIKSKTTASDEVVFFFSGHGTTGNYGIADEALDEGIYLYDGKVIWDDDLKVWTDSLSAFRVIFAFDSCEAGGMNDLEGTNRVVVMSSGETQSSWTYYLGGYNTGTKKKPNYQYSEGLFSHNFVVDGITNKLASGYNQLGTIYPNGQVAMEEAFGYTYPLVELKQQPVLSDLFTDDLVLGLNN